MEIQARIRIAIIPLLGIFDVNVTEEGTVSISGGYESQFLEMLLQGMNAPYKLLVPTELDWGTQHDNGKWTGLMGMVTRNDADMAMGNIFLNPSRQEYVDYSFPYGSDRLTFATRNPKEISRAYTLLYPFTPALWLCLIGTVTLFPVVLKYLMFKRNSLNKLFLDVLRSVLNKPVSFRPSTLGDKLLITSWIFAALIISLSYSTVLLSFLTIPLREKGVTDIEELSKAVQQGTVRCFFVEGNTMARGMSNHSNPSIRLIMKEVVKNMWYLNSKLDNVKKTILGDTNALIETDNHLKLLLGNDIFVSRDSFSRYQLVVILNKRFKMRERLSSVIHRITASGVYLKSVHDYLHHKMADHEVAVKKDAQLQINLKRLTGAFLLLCIGNIVALCVFASEIIHFKFVRKVTSII